MPHEVAAINREIELLMDRLDHLGNKIGNYRCGVYAFFDYDEEPIYVGKTVEKIRTRIGRHLTGRRSDAVAKSVLDPFEVAYVEVYPFPELERMPGRAASEVIAQAEYALYLDVLRRSLLKAVLNEQDIPSTAIMDLPPVYRAKIIPEDIFERREHPDVRLARRASTVASLAQIISEREVKPGIRRTLLTQARRIELLARRRLNDFADSDPGVEEPGTDTGEDTEA